MGPRGPSQSPPGWGLCTSCALARPPSEHDPPGPPPRAPGSFSPRAPSPGFAFSPRDRTRRALRARKSSSHKPRARARESSHRSVVHNLVRARREQPHPTQRACARARAARNTAPRSSAARRAPPQLRRAHRRVARPCAHVRARNGVATGRAGPQPANWLRTTQSANRRVYQGIWGMDPVRLARPRGDNSFCHLRICPFLLGRLPASRSFWPAAQKNLEKLFRELYQHF